MIDRNQYDSYIKRARRESEYNGRSKTPAKSIHVPESFINEPPVVELEIRPTPTLEEIGIETTSLDSDRWISLGIQRIGWQKTTTLVNNVSTEVSYKVSEEDFKKEFLLRGYERIRLEPAYDYEGTRLLNHREIYAAGEKAENHFNLLATLVEDNCFAGMHSLIPEVKYIPKSK